MSLQSKLSALVAILIADLLFFSFVSEYYPEVFEDILQRLPWEDKLEKAIMVMSGLIIAVLSSVTILHVLIKHLQKGD